MKAKIWVLSAVLTDENAPAMPAVFADEAEARVPDLCDRLPFQALINEQGGCHNDYDRKRGNARTVA